MRNMAFPLTLLLGIVLVVVGLLLSAPLGATDGPAISNPKMDFAPTLFVLGVVITFVSAVVYELTGD